MAQVPSPKRLLLAGVLEYFCLIGRLAQAVSFTWDGGGPDDRFDTVQNWSVEAAPLPAAAPTGTSLERSRSSSMRK